MGQLWGKTIRVGAAVAAVTLLACQAQLRENAVFSITDVISGVTDASGTVHATLVRGAPPSPAGGPTATVSGIGVMINGGSSPQTVGGSAAFNQVVVAIEGMSDYYVLALPAAASSQGVIVNANPNAYAGTMTFLYGAGDAGAGTIGAYARQSMRFLRVGTGDVQISVAWTDTADVDLHVIDPSGEQIYFAHKTAASGGTLDLDGNAACGLNTLPDGSHAHVSNENVVWPTGTAPSGTYKVILDYWSDCGVPQTDWVVTIQRVGAAPQIFTGSFVGVASGVPDDTVSVFTR
jgi:hypothetical protein